VQGAEQPALSPDGTLLVYLNYDALSSSKGVWIADSSGVNPRQYLPADSFYAVASPRFSPDGQSIVISGSGDFSGQQAHAPDLAGVGVAQAHGLPWNIWQIALADSEMTQLTTSTLDGPWITWSPDRQYMAVLAAEGVYVRENDRFFRVAQVTSEGEITWVR
jgi:Tol biopolymer transport system component